MRQQLCGVDNLGIEPGCHLDTDDTREQEEIHSSQVRFLVPRDRILHRHAMDDVVGSMVGGASTHDRQLNKEVLVVVGMCDPSRRQGKDLTISEEERSWDGKKEANTGERGRKEAGMVLERRLSI